MISDNKALVSLLSKSGIQSKAVLEAVSKVPRDQFVAEHLKPYAFEDEALPIECEQTISQPFIVARMTELIWQEGRLAKVLEVGTGSGYQAAVLAQLYDEVYTLERIDTLLKQARQRFIALGYQNINSYYADGFEGWSSKAPYDAIIVTAAAPEIPMALLEQLADGGRLVVPVGVASTGQRLQRVTRNGDDYEIESLDPVVFVPMLPGRRE